MEDRVVGADARGTIATACGPIQLPAPDADIRPDDGERTDLHARALSACSDITEREVDHPHPPRRGPASRADLGLGST